MSLCHQSWLCYPFPFHHLLFSVIVFLPLVPAMLNTCHWLGIPYRPHPALSEGLRWTGYALRAVVLCIPAASHIAVCSCPLGPSYGGCVWISLNLGKWHQSLGKWYLADSRPSLSPGFDTVHKAAGDNSFQFVPSLDSFRGHVLQWG